MSKTKQQSKTNISGSPALHFNEQMADHPESNKSIRLVSIDALRGFDMLLIAGGGTFLSLLENKTGLVWVDWIAGQLKHPAWNGFTFYDFIFPLFLFISGVSLAFSLNKGIENGLSKTDLYKKAFWRMLLLIILGIFDKNQPVTFFDPAQIRVASVLGRIGVAGFLATLLYLNFSLNKRLIWVFGVLLVYYAAIFLIPVPGFGAGNLSIEGNLVGWFDRNFLPGRLLQKIYDENGLLTQFPAFCLAAFGSMAGDLLRSNEKDSKKLLYLILAGLTGITLGYYGVYISQLINTYGLVPSSFSRQEWPFALSASSIISLMCCTISDGRSFLWSLA